MADVMEDSCSVEAVEEIADVDPVSPQEGPPQRELTFWELYAKLGDRYAADLSSLSGELEADPCRERALRSILSERSSMSALKSPLAMSGTSDDTLAKSQGLKLQKVLCDPDGFTPSLENPPASRPESFEKICDTSFDVRICWVDQDGASSAVTTMRRRVSLTTMQSQDLRIVQQLAAAEPRCFVFLPHGNFRIAWDVSSVICILLELLVNPLHAFRDLWPQDQLSMWSVTELMLRIFWNIDILVTMRTAVFSSGHLDFRPLAILARYAKGWLIFDLLLGVVWPSMLAKP